MKGKDLLVALSYIDRKYIEDGEIDEISLHHLPLKKTVLIAAILSLLVLLAGCVAVFLGLQQRKIGELENHRNFDAYGSPLEAPPENLTLVSMSGLEGTPAWQASKEWFEFTQSHVVENLTNEVDHPNIPNNYEYTYSCWDQAMVDKLNEIAEKYDLKLLGERAAAQRWQREEAFEMLGISGLIRPDAQADYSYGVAMLHPPYNFKADVTLTLTGEDAPWKEEVIADLYYLKSGYLSPYDVFTYDPNGEQWEYKTADGSRVLLALSGTNGLILCQREDAAIVIHLTLYWQGVFLEEEMSLPTRQSMEQIADCFDFTITTKALEDGLQKKLDAIPDPNAAQEPPIPETAYTTYAQYIAQSQYPEFMEYAFYDLNQDGQDELLIGFGDGKVAWMQTIRDGKVDTPDGVGFPDGITLLENDLFLVEGETILESYWFVKSMTPTATGVTTANVCSGGYKDGVWTLNGQACTKEEADAAYAQYYTPLKLDWTPLAEFPMDDGGTFGDVLAEEFHPSGQALLDFYGANAPQSCGWDTDNAKYYGLKDLNGDGVEELLVSSDGEYINAVYTVKRGRLEAYGGQFFLCRDNMEMSWDDWEGISTGKCKRYHFSRKEADRTIFYECYLHNEQTGIWYDEVGRQLPDGMDPLAQYPRETLHMRPIEELLKLG